MKIKLTNEEKQIDEKMYRNESLETKKHFESFF